MADAVLTVGRGAQLVAVVNYPSVPAGPLTFVVRARIGDSDPPLVKLASTDVTFVDGQVTVDGATVTVKVYGPKVRTLPAYSEWSLWEDAGADDALVVTGSLRVREVVQP